MSKYLLLIFVLVSCNSENKSATNKSDKNDLHSLLIGQWGSLTKGRPTFDITEDSIYHFGNNKALPYVMQGNDMIITENGIRSTYYNVMVFDDTLIFESPRNYEIAAIRFREYHPH